jgi:hypothetical protein
VTIERLARRLTFGSFADGVALRVRTSEPSALKVELAVRRSSGGKRRFTVVARKAFQIAAGHRVVRLAPRPRALRGRDRFVARVRVVATDGAGHRGVATRQLRVAPAGG